MCRTTDPSATLFTAPAGILAGSPLSLPLCYSYPTNKAAVVEAPTKQAVQRTGLEFVLCAEGIRFTDLAFAREVRRRVAELKRSAEASDAEGNNTRLAQRTLKFRRMV
ncbi:hypothetical protein PR003_g22806 [Phytophthora rubi]|uniref:Uncharacterized protein n=1 Tax=Phytophthora rubi TaxID=129364 RepID=A0A6A3IQL6_9STRA|nr:hypothetical protein PR001_g23278 [Phytophthora rubi]KAE8987048.1 hypothetical protein PR002_g22167 [Phytophthora rubi]KAE9300187.1 hypothetical protein PR003_g22806 [Phytophthora rubi]